MCDLVKTAHHKRRELSSKSVDWYVANVNIAVCVYSTMGVVCHGAILLQCMNAIGVLVWDSVYSQRSISSSSFFEMIVDTAAHVGKKGRVMYVK